MLGTLLDTFLGVTNMAKLTVKELERLTSVDAGKRLTDERSLYGVTKLKGVGVAVMFRWRYRFDGKLRDFTCGTWPNKSLKEIREACDDARQLLSHGKDPNEAKKIDQLMVKAEQAEAVAEAVARIDETEILNARITVFDLFGRWGTVELSRRKDGGKEVRRMFEKDVLPTIGHLAVESVKKRHITAVTDDLLARGVNRMAKLIFSLMRQMFRFAVDRGIIEVDPTASIRKAKIGGKDTERDRVLSEDEIKELNGKLPDAKLLLSTECAVWLALSTCCRIGELMNARWEHINYERNTWLIPEEHSKNGKAHIVALSEFAARHFRRLQRVNGNSPWCYPNASDTAAVCSKTVTKQLGDRQRAASPMSRRSSATNTLSLSRGKWTPHDLRRTGATMMTMLHVLPEVAERCLNHVEENKVKRIYQRHSYENEMREAWRLLGERLDLLTRADAANVVLITENKAA